MLDEQILVPKLRLLLICPYSYTINFIKIFIFSNIRESGWLLLDGFLNKFEVKLGCFVKISFKRDAHEPAWMLHAHEKRCFFLSVCDKLVI